MTKGHDPTKGRRAELARILRVSGPTVYDWLDDGRPNADNVSRIQALLRLLRESKVTSANALFPRFVRSPLEPGGRPLLDVLAEETIDEAAARNAIERRRGWATRFNPGATSAKHGCGQRASRNRTMNNGKPISLRTWRSWSGREISEIREH